MSDTMEAAVWRALDNSCNICKLRGGYVADNVCESDRCPTFIARVALHVAAHKRHVPPAPFKAGDRVRITPTGKSHLDCYRAVLQTGCTHGTGMVTDTTDPFGRVGISPTVSPWLRVYLDPQDLELIPAKPAPSRPKQYEWPDEFKNMAPPAPALPGEWRDWPDRCGRWLKLDDPDTDDYAILWKITCVSPDCLRVNRDGAIFTRRDCSPDTRWLRLPDAPSNA